MVTARRSSGSSWMRAIQRERSRPRSRLRERDAPQQRFVVDAGDPAGAVATALVTAGA